MSFVRQWKDVGRVRRCGSAIADPFVGLKCLESQSSTYHGEDAEGYFCICVFVDDCAVVYTSGTLRDRVFMEFNECVRLRNDGPLDKLHWG